MDFREHSIFYDQCYFMLPSSGRAAWVTVNVADILKTLLHIKINLLKEIWILKKKYERMRKLTNGSRSLPTHNSEQAFCRHAECINDCTKKHKAPLYLNSTFRLYRKDPIYYVVHHIINMAPQNSIFRGLFKSP